MRPLLALLLTSALVAPSPAVAQQTELAAVQEQLAAMQAEIARLTAQVAELQAREAQREAEPPPAPAPTAPVSPTVTFKGAPEITAEGGWSFKPRGRLQVDTAAIDGPAAIAGNSLGHGTEFRRAYFGVDGTLPGGFGYRLEADFANSSVDLTDVYLTYKASNGLTLTAGQHKPFWGLEEMTSDLFTPFMERAAFHAAFGFERRAP
jgi:phosphate-selective porin OprO and OprP